MPRNSRARAHIAGGPQSRTPWHEQTRTCARDERPQLALACHPTSLLLRKHGRESEMWWARAPRGGPEKAGARGSTSDLQRPKWARGALCTAADVYRRARTYRDYRERRRRGGFRGVPIAEFRTNPRRNSKHPLLPMSGKKRTKAGPVPRLLY